MNAGRRTKQPATLARPKPGPRVPKPREPEETHMTLWIEGREVVVRFMFIDPAAATLMLNANTHNRNVSPLTVDGYALDMIQNHWRFTGDPIQFGEDDLLLNGQHRLMAIEQSGIGQWLMVIENLPNAVQINTDTGLRRTAGQQFNLADDIEGASQRTSIANLLLQWAHWVHEGTSIKPTIPGQILHARKLADSIERAIVAAREVHTGRKIEGKRFKEGGVGGSVSVTALAALHVRACQVAPLDTVELFFHKLIFGERFGKGEDPVRRLRNVFINNNKANLYNDLFKGAMGWNASMTGGGLGAIQLPQRTKTRVAVAKIPDLVGPYREDLSEERVAALAALERLEGKGN